MFTVINLMVEALVADAMTRDPAWGNPDAPLVAGPLSDWEATR